MISAKRKFDARHTLPICYGREEVVYRNWTRPGENNEFTIQEAGVTFPCRDYHMKRLGDEISVPNLFTLEYVRSGSGYIETAAKTYRIKAGDTYLLRWNEEYVYYSDPTDPLEKAWINFSGSIISGMLTFYSMQDTVNIVATDTNSRFSQICDTLQNIEQLGYRAAYVGVLHGIMKIFDSMEEGYSRRRPRLQRLAANVKDIIDGTPNYCITVSRLAEMSHYCERHIERAFKESYGISIKKYIILCKIEQAKQMIRHSSHSQKDIASMLEFCDYNHFSGTFRALTGETPAQFAKRENGNE